MAGVEEVGIRLALMGKGEYLAGIDQASKALGDLGAASKASGDAAARASTGTKAQQDALKAVRTAADQAVASQRAYEKALTDHADPAAAAARADTAVADAQDRLGEASSTARTAVMSLTDAEGALADAADALAVAEARLAEATTEGADAELASLKATRDNAAENVTAAGAARDRAAAEAESAGAVQRSAVADVEAAQASRRAAEATADGVVAARAKRDEATAAVGAAASSATAEEALAERTRLAGVKKISTWEAFKTEVLGVSATVETAGVGVADEEAVSASKIEAANARKVESFRSFGATGALVAGGVAVAAGAVVVKTSEMAASFDQSMIRIATQAGVPEEKLDGLKQAVLGVAGKVGTDPDSLAEAMYHVEGAFAKTGISLQDATHILTVAAEGARIGGANLVDVQNALDAAVVVGIPGVQNFDQAMGALNATVGAGDMHMQDLADAFGAGNLAMWKSAGLSIRDVGAALADFGDANLRGAAAGTQLRMAVQSMEVPAKGGKAALKELGLQQDTLAKDMQTGGLNKAMTDLHQRLVATGHAGNDMGLTLTEAFGKKAGAGINTLMNDFNRVQGAYKEIDKGANAFAEDWTMQSQTAAQKSADFKASVSALGIQMGNVFLPALTAVTGALATMVTFFAQHQSAAVALAFVIGTLLVGAVVALGVALWTSLAANPVVIIITAIIVAVALLGFGIYELVTHWNAVWGAISGAVSGAWHAVTGAISAGWSSVMGFFGRMWSDVTGFFSKWGTTILAVLVPFIGIPILIVQHWDQIVDWFKKLPGRIAEGLGVAIGAVIGFFYKLPERIEMAVINASAWLYTTGLAILNGLMHGIVMGYVDTVAWFAALPSRIEGFFKSAGTWLLNTGKDIVNGIGHGFANGYAAVTVFFATLPSKVKAFFNDAPGWLERTGSDIINGLLRGLASMAAKVVGWFAELKDKFLSGFKRGLGISSPSTVFAEIGTFILQGLLGGLQAMASSIVGFFSGFASRLANGFKVELQQLAQVGLWIWHTIMEPVVHGIDAAWDWLLGQLSATGQSIMAGLRLWGSIFTWLWQNIVMPVVHGIDSAVDWLRQQIADAEAFMINGLRNLGSFFTWLYEQAVKKAVNDISTIWHWLHDNVIKPVGDAIGVAVHAIGQAFSDTVDWIKRTWQTISDIVRVPVSFVVNTVYGKGIKPTWDAIAGVFGLPLAPPAPAFAGGGIAGDDPQGSALPRAARGRVMPGYEPGHDRFHIAVGGGEAIMRPEWTRMAQRVLGPSAIDMMNAEAQGGRTTLLGRVAAAIGNAQAQHAGPQAGGVRDSPFARRYAGGGVADLPIPPVPADGPNVSMADSVLKGFGNLFMIPKLVTDPQGYFTDLFKPFVDPLSGMGSSRFMQSMKDVPAKAIEGIVAKVKDWISSMMSGGAAMGPESASHALDIVNATKAKGLHHDAAVIALMTGLQESGIRVLANPAVPASMGIPHDGVGHDHDSVGIFQQRQSWGPTPLLMNPFGSAELFLNKLGGGPYGDFGAAAQRVQVSAAPGAYSKWQGQATGLAGPNFWGGGIVGVSGGVPFGGARAVGGPISPGTAYLVGESGPELVTPSSPGTVVPSDVTAALGDGGSGRDTAGGARRGDVHFHPGAIVVNAAPTPQATAQAVADEVSNRMARQ